MKKYQLIHNGLYKLEEKEKSEKSLDARHRSNIVLAVNEYSQWKFYDIFYGMDCRNTVYLFDEIKDRMTFLFAFGKSKDVSEREFAQYEDAHKLFLPANAYTPQRHLIFRDAPKSRTKILELLNDAVERAENQIKLQQAHIDFKKLQIIDIETGRSIENIEI